MSKINTAKAPAAAQSEDPKASLITSVAVVAKPGSQAHKEYTVDPAYFDEHVADASAKGFTAQVVGNAVRVDY